MTGPYHSRGKVSIPYSSGLLLLLVERGGLRLRAIRFNPLFIGTSFVTRPQDLLPDACSFTFQSPIHRDFFCDLALTCASEAAPMVSIPYSSGLLL